MTFDLYDYQQQAVDIVEAAWAAGQEHVNVEIPTGGGKTVVAASLIRHHRLQTPSDRCLFLSHLNELVGQAQARLEDHIGEDVARLDGLVSAKRRVWDAPVTSASIQTLGRTANLDRYLAAGMPGLVVIDECHHAAAAGYVKVIEVLAGRGHPRLAGLSATPYRADGKDLPGRLAFSRTREQLREAGVLSTVTQQRVAIASMELTPVPTTTKEGQKDYRLANLGEVVNQQAVVTEIAEACEPLLGDRRTLTFCVDVEHARALAEAFNFAGVSADCYVEGVHRGVLTSWQNGSFQVLTSVGRLLEGFDDPGITAMIMARPTKSLALYTQMLGRGSRPSPDGRDCLVLDITDSDVLTDASPVDLAYLDGVEAVAGDDDRPFLYGLDRRRSVWAWVRVEEGLVCSVGDLGTVYLVPDPPGGSGLWRAYLSPKGKEPQLLRAGEQGDGRADLRRAVHLVGSLVRANVRLVGADAVWRKGHPTPAQLIHLDPAVRKRADAEEWNKGRVSDHLTAKFCAKGYHHLYHSS